MPPRRIAGSARVDCVLRVDGEDVGAASGEPIAVSLAASGRLVLGRSVKYHRPRGAACYAGRCDGCLMRVGGLPSQTTCRVPAAHGTIVETQNVLGLGTGAEIDLLAATDWFFPGGMNHHEMFTWSKAANRAMQTIARRVAGVGRLPDEPLAPVRPVDRACDVLVIGGGPTGLECAARCARSGLRTLLLDEEESPGGHLRFVPGMRARADDLTRAARDAGVEIHARRGGVGVYDARDEGATAVAAGDAGILRVRARRLVFAQGRHEGAWAFEGNDLPGVIGSEAALRLLSHGVLPGDRIVLAGHEPSALEPLATALREAGAHVEGPLELASIARARGRNGISKCDVRDRRSLSCDALVIAPPTTAVYELAEQAGVEVAWRPPGVFELVASPDDGSTRVRHARAIGRASGIAALDDGLAQASAAAKAIATEIAHG